MGYITFRTGLKLAIRAVIDRYRKALQQESVLWETSQVCAAL
jgi:hypothetical protein